MIHVREVREESRGLADQRSLICNLTSVVVLRANNTNSKMKSFEIEEIVTIENDSIPLS